MKSTGKSRLVLLLMTLSSMVVARPAFGQSNASPSGAGVRLEAGSAKEEAFIPYSLVWALPASEEAQTLVARLSLSRQAYSPAQCGNSSFGATAGFNAGDSTIAILRNGNRSSHKTDVFGKNAKEHLFLSPMPSSPEMATHNFAPAGFGRVTRDSYNAHPINWRGPQARVFDISRVDPL